MRVVDSSFPNGMPGHYPSRYEAMEPTEYISGTVKSIAAYGAFVELEPGVSGLCHISQLAEGRVESVEAVVAVRTPRAAALPM